MKQKITTVFFAIAITALLGGLFLLMITFKLQQNEELKKTNNLLTALNASSVSPDDLSEIKNFYWELNMDPCSRGDDITEKISGIIKNKIDKTIGLTVGGKKYPPIEMYIVDSIVDPDSFQCHSEDGYADDSIHLPEFLNFYSSISYNKSDTFLMSLEGNFRLVAEPHIYPGHDWKALKIKKGKNNNFNLPPGLSNAVLFSIIEEKKLPKRKYKVFWIVNYK